MTHIVQAHAFTGLAEDYRKSRPSYPAGMLAAIADFAAPVLADGALYLDIGAGTGISTLAVAEALPARCRTMGVEPNADMRAQADALKAAGGMFEFVAGAADDLPIGAGEAALLTAGQAVQWFDRPKFYAEALRVLQPGGVLAIFENNRDWRGSALLDAHETFLETHSVSAEGKHYSRFYRDHPYAQEFFRAFGNVTASHYTWTREMRMEDFVSMAKSSTQVQRAIRHIGEAEAVALIERNCAAHATDGVLQIAYVTELYMARRA